MQIDLSKDYFTPSETNYILERLGHAAKKGYITPRNEENVYLIASFKGVEQKGISPKWNIKIYSYKAKIGGHSLVCVDKHVLQSLINEQYDDFVPPELPVLRIDDAGWGFPLCGVMVGVSDEKDVKTAVVPVDFFLDHGKNHFDSKRYLKEYAKLAQRLIKKFGGAPETHRIEICTGYVNQPLREKLRELGYDVRVVEIKGMLQNRLEKMFKAYVLEEIGADLYYDPKDMDKRQIPKSYKECLAYGRKHCPEKIKTGWQALNGAGPKE